MRLISFPKRAFKFDGDVLYIKGVGSSLEKGAFHFEIEFTSRQIQVRRRR